ncbi:MAG: P-type conjugative transfer protein TrbJ [Acidobacteria bacterium]|nr:P-type conjugative transfer protein TrbJ [Acidobacteriota bacterium]
MNRKLSRRAAMLTAAAVILPGAHPARAGIVGGFATEWTQLANNLQLITTYIRQGEELRQKILMVLDMAKNTAELPFQVFGPIMADIGQLAGIVQSGRSLAYSMANLDGEFRSRFRGWGYNARAWFTDYKNWSQTSLDTTLGTLRAAGLQSQQMQSEEAVLKQLRGMANSSDGRMKAIQIANQIAEQQVQQLMKLRQLILADLQSKQAFQAAQIQREASSEASTERFFRFNRRTGDGRGFQAVQ